MSMTNTTTKATEMTNTNPANQAIAQSIAQDEIVTLERYERDESPSERRETADLKLDLLNACDDFAENGGTSEYWGTDDAGNHWRVHVREG